ncbi:glycoside hydrolase family 108 protein [Nostoc sp. 'Peltigera membranacea cyanobiont' 232]|uniref:glycoside hydrolase family 108 protein n=1 Tax=Nostoc sp. 'Peltigera membranacea cyanobiont' 232 TaxID=2014531 RepID=UPI001676BB34|nr:glycosyl hydrolase 108 family protein [Nostoc sp. 'Peltigera membranacea cyanobiont' 232]
MTCILIPDIISALCFLAFNCASPDSKLMKSIQQAVEVESQQMKDMSTEINKLKKNYQDLNKELSQEQNFKEGLKFVLASEGGVSDDAADSGGLTNLGITHSEYAQYRASHGLPSRSVREISLLEARDIYKHIYWTNSGCGVTPRRIAISCFDWQVNSNRGFSTLQQVLGVDVDGIPGHQTYNELNSWLSKPKNETVILHNYFGIREADYRRWGVGSQSVFLTGWLNRSRALKTYLQVP